MSDQQGVTPASTDSAVTATPPATPGETAEDIAAQEALADAVASAGNDRLPDDHPVVVALHKANAEAEKHRKRVKEFEDRDKSELEKATEAREEAEKAAAAAKTEALRYRIAAKHGITDADADLFLTGGDEDTITKQAARYAELSTAKETPPPSGGPVVRRSGTGGGTAPSGTVAAGRALFTSTATNQEKEATNA